MGKFTCSDCLAGNSYKCRSRDCANFGGVRQLTPQQLAAQEHRALIRKALRAARERPSTATGTRRSNLRPGTLGRKHGPTGVTLETRHAIAEDLLQTALTYRAIAVKHGVTYEQVRTVMRNLDTMNRRGSSKYDEPLVYSLT